MEKPYSVKPTKRVSLLILGFFAISGAWMFSSHASTRPSKNASTSEMSAFGQSGSSRAAITQTIPSQQGTARSAKSAKQGQSTIAKSSQVKTATESQVKVVDNPLPSGPSPLSWTEGKVTYRAVHYVTEWDASSRAWIKLSPDLTEDTEVGTPGYDIDGITAAAHTGASWYVGTLAGQLTVKRQNTDWTIVQGILPMRTITAIALPPNDSTGNEAVVGYGGYGTATPNAPGHLYSTADGGHHWQDITGNLPDRPVQSIHFLNQWTSNSLVAEVNGTWYQMTRPGVWVTRTSPNHLHESILSLLRSWF